MQKLALTVLALLFAVAVPAVAARGKVSRYVGIHPIPKSEGGGICYIEGPHVHVYAADKLQYRDHRGSSYFVGDPVAYGYDGPRVTYKGPHPIHVEAVVDDGSEPDTEYCYIDGPHFHAFAPPPGPDFQLVGDAYFYVGEPPRAFLDARPAMVKINAIYEPLAYARPVVEVDAPMGWIGARVEVVGPAPVVVVPPVRAGIAVGAEVRIPTPSLRVDVGVGVPGVIVDERVKVKHDNGRHRGHR